MAIKKHVIEEEATIRGGFGSTETHQKITKVIAERILSFHIENPGAKVLSSTSFMSSFSTPVGPTPLMASVIIVYDDGK